MAHQEAIKPGFTRLSFPYFMDPSEVEYILQAIHFIANDGWKLLPLYKYDVSTAAWTHRARLSVMPHSRASGTLRGWTIRQ